MSNYLDKGREQVLEGEGILFDDFWQKVEPKPFDFSMVPARPRQGH